MDYFKMTTMCCQRIGSELNHMHSLWEETGTINVDKSDYTAKCYRNLINKLTNYLKTIEKEGAQK